MAGFSVSRGDQTHYLLANIALVGETITLVMQTTINNKSKNH